MADVSHHLKSTWRRRRLRHVRSISALHRLALGLLHLSNPALPQPRGHPAHATQVLRHPAPRSTPGRDDQQPHRLRDEQGR